MLRRVLIADLSLTERQHLQEWIIANPTILAPDALIITFEFDRWRSASGAQPRDRLDVLALGSDGRLIVAELKRGTAPDPTEMQAIKYAAMASRFQPAQLALKRLEFLRSRPGGTALDEESVLTELVNHTDGQLKEETIRKPRIVLVAEQYSAVTTTSVVWLTEMGLDVTLVTFRAYATPAGETVVTTSRLWPVPQAEQFVAAPRPEPEPIGESLPTVAWTTAELRELADGAGPFMLTVLDALAAHPGELWGAIEFRALDMTPYQASGALGAIATAARRRFGRANPPITFTKARGTWHWYMETDIAEMWRHLRDGEGP